MRAILAPVRMASLRDDLLDPSAYPDDADEGRAAISLVETHISLVYLRGDEVFKVKKPLDLGFLDFRTLDARHAACEAEVRLNRRLAPDVYLDVVPVKLGEDGRHRVDGEGEIVDWAVHMVRLSDAGRADQLLAKGLLDGEAIDRVAEALVRFHEVGESSEKTRSFGAKEVIAHSVRENFEQTRDVVHRYLSPSEASAIESFQMATIEEETSRFRDRIRAGRIRDGHGDLRLEHLYFRDDGRITIIDCIEFNERFRYADTCADLAFLAMDLAFHGRVDLKERLLATYARESGDYDLYGLVDFYESYRAYVRAKVSTMLADDREAPFSTRARAATLARRYFLLALSSLRPPLSPPMVIAVGGVIASGKSTLARKLGELWTSPVIETDRTRKQLLGIRPSQAVRDPAWQGAYATDFTERTYGEVLRRADLVLESKRSVILDASFRSAASREAARELARSHGVPFLFVECRAPREICRERLVRREREGGISDGRLAIFDDFCAEWEDPSELPEGEHLVLDTSGSLEESVRLLYERLGPG